MSAVGASPNRARAARFSTVRIVAAALLLFVPTIVLLSSPLAPATVFTFVSLIPTLLALLHGRRFALATALATAVVVAVVELANPSTVAAVIVMVVLGLGIGLCGLRGWQSIATIVCSWPAMLIVSAPLAFSASTLLANGWPAAAGSPGHPALGWLFAYPGSPALAAIITLIGGLWTVAVARVLLTDLPNSPFTPIDRTTALAYGVSLAIGLGVATFVASTWAYGTTAGWALLTILIVARPGIRETWHRVDNRTLGTLAGGIGAAALALIVPVSEVLVVVGFVALLAAIVLLLKKANYAVYSVALTAAIVLLNSHGSDVVAVDVQRVLFTLAGVVLTAAVIALLQITLSRRAA